MASPQYVHYGVTSQDNPTFRDIATATVNLTDQNRICICDVWVENLPGTPEPHLVYAAGVVYYTKLFGISFGSWNFYRYYLLSPPNGTCVVNWNQGGGEMSPGRTFIHLWSLKNSLQSAPVVWNSSNASNSLIRNTVNSPYANGIVLQTAEVVTFTNPFIPPSTFSDTKLYETLIGFAQPWMVFGQYKDVSASGAQYLDIQMTNVNDYMAAAVYIEYQEPTLDFIPKYIQF